MTKYEHCQKCGKQVEFVNKNKNAFGSHNTVIKEHNLITFGRRYITATMYSVIYCDQCYYNLLDLLESKHYLKHGDVKY